MARTLTPNDGYVVIQDVANQLLGKDAPGQIDSTNFISVGEQIKTLSQDKVFDAINLSLGRFIMAVRPLEEAFNIIQAIDGDAYSTRIRKISFYSKNTKPSGWFNTDLYTNHATGYTAGTNGDPDQTTGRTPSTKSQWEQNLAVPLEMDFGGMTTWQYAVTNLIDDGKYAFEDEDEWVRFLEGYMTQHENDMKMEREAFKRLTFNSFVAQEYNIGTTLESTGIARNLTAEFNTKFGTSYTTAELLSTYFSDFLSFFVATTKKDIKLLRRNTVLQHIFPPKTEGSDDLVLPRHTPTRNQKMVLLDSFWIDAEAYVLPKIFNDQYLNKGNFESVEFWMNPSAPSEVNMKVDVPGWINDILTEGSSDSDTTAEVKIDYFLGAIFDEDAVLTNMDVQRVHTTGIEARKGFSNTWFTFVKNSIVDPTEKAIIYYMADPSDSGDDQAPSVET